MRWWLEALGLRLERRISANISQLLEQPRPLLCQVQHRMPSSPLLQLRYLVIGPSVITQFVKVTAIGRCPIPTSQGNQ